MTWDWCIIGFLFLGWLFLVAAIKAIWGGTPDHTRKRRPYVRRMGRKNDSL